MKKQNGISQIFVMVVMLILAIALPVTANLVKKVQDNRSSAATETISQGLICTDSERGKTTCVSGKTFICTNIRIPYWNKIANDCSCTRFNDNNSCTAMSGCAWGYVGSSMSCSTKIVPTCSSKGGTCKTSGDCSTQGGSTVSQTDCTGSFSGSVCCVPKASTPASTITAPTVGSSAWTALNNMGGISNKSTTVAKGNCTGVSGVCGTFPSKPTSGTCAVISADSASIIKGNIITGKCSSDATIRCCSGTATAAPAVLAPAAVAAPAVAAPVVAETITCEGKTYLALYPDVANDAYYGTHPQAHYDLHDGGRIWPANGCVGNDGSYGCATGNAVIVNCGGLGCSNGACNAAPTAVPAAPTAIPTAIPVCTVGDKQCSGTNLQTCNGNGSGWGTTTDCGAIGCNATTKVCNVCTNGDQKCSTANNYSTCTGGVWPSSLTNCASGKVCTNGATGTAVCKDPDYTSPKLNMLFAISGVKKIDTCFGDLKFKVSITKNGSSVATTNEITATVVDNKFNTKFGDQVFKITDFALTNDYALTDKIKITIGSSRKILATIYGKDNQFSGFPALNNSTILVSDLVGKTLNFYDYPVLNGDIGKEGSLGVADNVVNGFDFAFMKSEWGKTCSTGQNLNADLNGDCRVDTFDLQILKNAMAEQLAQKTD